MKLKVEKYNPDEWYHYVVRTGKYTCRKAKDGDTEIYLGHKISKNGVVDAIKPKPWAVAFPYKAMRRFVQDANYAPWKNKNMPRFVDWIYFA